MLTGVAYVPSGGYARVAMLGLEWGRLELDGTALTGPAIGTVAAIGTAPTELAVTTGAGNNWHGNNWHGNNWHNGHHHNGNDVVFIGGFGFPWWWGWGPSWGWDYGYPYSYYPYGYGGAYGYGYGGYQYGNGYGYNNGYGNGMATDTAPSTSLATETAANPESPSCNSGCHALAITMDPSTESWGRKRGAQSGRTSKTTITQVNRRHSGHADRSRAAIIFRLIGRRFRRARGERTAGRLFCNVREGQFRRIIAWDVAHWGC